jgi:glutamine synthetase
MIVLLFSNDTMNYYKLIFTFHMAKIKAEYIWIDGHKPTAGLRSKTKILDSEVSAVSELPLWGFDGSSTEQAEGHFSDCQLKPVKFVLDPIRGDKNILVLCEVLTASGEVHPSNTRAHLRELVEKYKDQEAWFGIEQEYTLFRDGRPVGFPEGGYPAPQGPYYCGVGTENVFAARWLVEGHLDACLKAGLTISGINAEVMPGQWEFQVGTLGPLEVSDELWIARWLLKCLGENYNTTVSLHPKPMTGDWNGAGCHVNFSTKAMREDGGMDVIEKACKAFGENVPAHIAVYGADNDKRLTGRHETCSINEFRYGVSDRGASIRIPMATANAKKGYLEDRRPASNMDPYEVTARMIQTVGEMK